MKLDFSQTRRLLVQMSGDKNVSLRKILTPMMYKNLRFPKIHLKDEKYFDINIYFYNSTSTKKSLFTCYTQSEVLELKISYKTRFKASK